MPEKQSLAFHGNELRFGRKVLGELTTQVVRARRLRKLRGKGVVQGKRGLVPARKTSLFEPSQTGERMGLVRAFAGQSGTIAYVSDFLLKREQLTKQQWRAARRA